MNDDYITLAEIREEVFYGLGNVSFWKLRKHRKFPATIGAKQKYISRSEAIAWRNKYWKVKAA